MDRAFELPKQATESASRPGNTSQFASQSEASAFNMSINDCSIDDIQQSLNDKYLDGTTFINGFKKIYARLAMLY